MPKSLRITPRYAVMRRILMMAADIAYGGPLAWCASLQSRLELTVSLCQIHGASGTVALPVSAGMPFAVIGQNVPVYLRHLSSCANA